ncbi:hypothetical protein B0H15DRAFT_779633 [Mycena belliarum]|uniref:Uncharacterized protein n=1 Tax=Mycena belliarum TaxID=1033014 RepID=A0AAD6XPP2_9AGAR|nr:hypothetical protein B0H15DRAFT_779633 [Mycena belliae]
MLFYFSVLAALALLLMLAFRYRAALLPHVPARLRALFPATDGYAPLASFSAQIGAGLSSSEFDLEANVRDGDSRAGLDEQGTREIMEIMRRERVGFDQARLIRHNRILAQNGIDPTGMPMDSKAVTRL